MEHRLNGRKTADRAQNGRFTVGNPGGPGRPRRAIERDYLCTISEACPVETWKEIVARAVADAKKGDAQARTWLSSYLCGKPTEQGKTLRAHLVEELAGVDMAAYDAGHMRRLFGGE